MNKQLCSVKVLVGILRMMLVLTFFSRACTSPHSDKAEAEPALRTQHALFAEPTFTFLLDLAIARGHNGKTAR